jgi:hypothetical protein
MGRNHFAQVTFGWALLGALLGTSRPATAGPALLCVERVGLELGLTSAPEPGERTTWLDWRAREAAMLPAGRAPELPASNWRRWIGEDPDRAWQLLEAAMAARRRQHHWAALGMRGPAPFEDPERLAGLLRALRDRREGGEASRLRARLRLAELALMQTRSPDPAVAEELRALASQDADPATRVDATLHLASRLFVLADDPVAARQALRGFPDAPARGPALYHLSLAADVEAKLGELDQAIDLLKELVLAVDDPPAGAEHRPEAEAMKQSALRRLIRLHEESGDPITHLSSPPEDPLRAAIEALWSDRLVAPTAGASVKAAPAPAMDRTLAALEVELDRVARESDAQARLGPHVRALQQQFEAAPTRWDAPLWLAAQGCLRAEAGDREGVAVLAGLLERMLTERDDWREANAGRADATRALYLAIELLDAYAEKSPFPASGAP